MKGRSHQWVTRMVSVALLVATALPLGVASLGGRLGQVFYRDPAPGDVMQAALAHQRATDTSRRAADTLPDGRRPRRGNVRLVLPVSPAYAAYLRQDSSLADRLLAYAYSYMGTPYRFGGKGPSHFDCAGFTRYVFRPFGESLGSGCSSQWAQSRPLKRGEPPHRGDLVFFGDRYLPGLVGHVGIVSNVQGKGFSFIHASTSAGVIVSKSTEAYYAQRFMGIRRVLADDAILPSPRP